jgi:hypothetical protein
MSDPTPEMLQDTRFAAIWQVIKSWDIHVRGGNRGSTSSHARAILDAIEAVEAGSKAEAASRPAWPDLEASIASSIAHAV